VQVYDYGGGMIIIVLFILICSFGIYFNHKSRLNFCKEWFDGDIKAMNKHFGWYKHIHIIGDFLIIIGGLIVFEFIKL
jgi:hypothetical protein